MKLLRIAHDSAKAMAYQTIAVASTLWLQASLRPHGCVPIMELWRVGDPEPVLIWAGTATERWQYSGTVRVDDVGAGDYYLRVGSADTEAGDYVDCVCLSAQTTMTDPTQLVPVSDATAVDDATWLAAWTADGATLSVITE
jgi:hypothetical protein